jgi:hypothetical protein
MRRNQVTKLPKAVKAWLDRALADERLLAVRGARRGAQEEGLLDLEERAAPLRAEVRAAREPRSRPRPRWRGHRRGQPRRRQQPERGADPAHAGKIMQLLVELEGLERRRQAGEDHARDRGPRARVGQPEAFREEVQRRRGPPPRRPRRSRAGRLSDESVEAIRARSSGSANEAAREPRARAPATKVKLPGTSSCRTSRLGCRSPIP